MRTRMEVAANVRAALAVAKLSQVAVAKQMGMSPTTFGKRINGVIAFDVEELERLAGILDIPYSQLAGVQAT